MQDIIRNVKGIFTILQTSRVTDLRISTTKTEKSFFYKRETTLTGISDVFHYLIKIRRGILTSGCRLEKYGNLRITHGNECERHTASFPI